MLNSHNSSLQNLVAHATATTDASDNVAHNIRALNFNGQRAMSSVPDRITLLNRANNGGRPTMSLPRNSAAQNTVRSSLPQANKFVLTEQTQVIPSGFQMSHMSAPVGNSGQLENYHVGRTLG